MSARNPRFIARGNILPSTVVKIDVTTGNNFGVVQATAATDKPVGVSQQGTHDAPGTNGASANAAADGQTLDVFGEGCECLVVAATAIVQGDSLKVANASGQVTTVTFAEVGTLWIVGEALESASGAGVLFRMRVRIQAAKSA